MTTKVLVLHKLALLEVTVCSLYCLIFRFCNATGSCGQQPSNYIYTHYKMTTTMKILLQQTFMQEIEDRDKSRLHQHHLHCHQSKMEAQILYKKRHNAKSPQRIFSASRAESTWGTNSGPFLRGNNSEKHRNQREKT